MSFQTVDYLSTLQADELQLIHRVYQRITAEPWVSQEQSVREELQRYIVGMYGRGLCYEDKLHRLCLAAAKDQFSVPASADDPRTASGQ